MDLHAAGLRRLAGAGVVGILLANFRGRVLEANDEFLAMVGYTRDDLAAGRLRWDTITPPEWAGVDAAIMRALVDAGEAKPVEKEYVHKAGHRVPVLVGGALLSRETTETTAFVVDLTRLRTAEAAAAARLALFRNTFEQAAVGMAHVGLDGRWLRINDRLAEIVGYGRDELQALTFQDITHPDDLAADEAQLARLLRGEADRYAIDKRYVRKNGSTVWIRLTASLVRRKEAGGAPDYFISVVEDIDARKRAEAAAEAARDEAEAAYIQAQAAYAEAERARADAVAFGFRARDSERAKSDFLATMSHELRTPLNAVLGYADLLLAEVNGPLTERQQTYVERQRAAGRHLLALVNDVLDVAKADAGRLLVTRERADAREAVLGALAMVQPHAAARQVTLRSPARDSAPEAGSPEAGSGGVGAYVGDPRRVEQVLINLLANAVKFTPAGGAVDVAFELRAAGPAARAGGGPEAPAPAWLLIHVRDTGVGIPADKREAVFQPFVQLDTGPTRGAAGTGLGLAISRRIARLMDGDVTLESREGEGSTFTLWLRAAPASLPTDVPADGPRDGGAALPAGVPADRRGPARQARGLYEVGDALLRAIDGIVLRYGERVRVDPAIPAARTAPWTELADHTATLLTDVAQALGIIEEAAGGPATLMRVGEEIRAVVADWHGRRRAQLGWTPDALERDADLLEEEVRAGVARALPADPAFPVAEGLDIVLRLLTRARAAARDAFRRERAGAAQ